MNFPQFRKYVNGKGFFRIDSPDRFTEIQLMGSKRWTTEFEAKTFVDRHLIQDLLDCADGRWEVIEEREFSEQLAMSTH